MCGSRVNNTSDKAFLLFTRDAGMLWASARSVREERSKQRFALQDFSLVKISLVRGKTGWRVGSVEGQGNFFVTSDNQQGRAGVTKLVRLLRQFIHGEESHPVIFDDTKVALRELSKETKDVETILEIFSLRLLYRLGYVAKADVVDKYLEEEKWWEMSPLPKAAAEMVERAKSVSHL